MNIEFGRMKLKLIHSKLEFWAQKPVSVEGNTAVKKNPILDEINPGTACARRPSPRLRKILFWIRKILSWLRKIQRLRKTGFG